MLLECEHTNSSSTLRAALSRQPYLIRVAGMLPSLTPKRAMALATVFSSDTPAELEESLKQGRPTPFAWLTPHRRQAILLELERARTGRGYLLMDEAESLSRMFIGQLEAEGGCVRVMATGEYRRCCPVIRALDFVAQTDDPLKAIRAFLNGPQRLRLLRRARSRVSAALGSGLEVTLSLAPAQDYGGLLLSRTGHRRHLVALAAIAQQKGLRLCSKGLRTGEGIWVRAEEESTVYSQLGLPFIPPELRDSDEWVKRAPWQGVPQLVEFKDLHGDLHLDKREGAVDLSAESAALRRLADAGLRYLTLFEPTTLERRGASEQGTTSPVPIDDRIHILRGVEVEIDLQGNLVPDPATLGHFDVLSARIMRDLQLSPEAQTLRLMNALRHPRLDILAQPHRHLRDVGSFTPFYEESLFRLAARAGIALEVSGAPDQLDLTGDSCRRLRHMGGQVALGSRGSARHAIRNLTWALGQARRGALRPEDIWNCRPAARLPLHHRESPA